MSLRLSNLSVYRRPIIHAFCCFNILPLISDIEPHDTRIVEDLIWKSIWILNRHAKDTFRNGSNRSLCNGNEAYHQEAHTFPHNKFFSSAHDDPLRFLPTLEKSFLIRELFMNVK